MGKGADKVRVSHLFFVDDALVLSEPDVNALLHLRCILQCFQIVSGLKINMKKTKSVRIGSRGDEKRLAQVLGCKVTTLPIKYLGIPLGLNIKMLILGIPWWIFLRRGGRGGKWRSCKPTYLLPFYIIYPC